MASRRERIARLARGDIPKTRKRPKPVKVKAHCRRKVNFADRFADKAKEWGF